MAENMSKMIDFFNLNKNGDSAIVRLLHSSVATIEGAKVHHTVIDGKRKCIKCLNTAECPLCNASNFYTSNRVYIHLWDYTDNKEKVWNRTDKIIDQLKEIETNWGDLSNCVLKIIREGDDFPKYNVSILPPTNYQPVDAALKDQKLAYRYYLTRSAEDMNTFLKTGIMPKKTPPANNNVVAKNEYFANPQTQQQQQITNTVPANNNSNPFSVSSNQSMGDTVDDTPFFDPFSITRV